MGLTNQVRDFFTSRINRVLDEKMKVVTAPIDNKLVEEVTLQRLSDKLGLVNVKARYQKVQQQLEQAKAEETKLENEMRDALKRHDEKLYNDYRYYSNIEHTFQEVANREYKDEVLAKLYPEVIPQIKKIEAIKDDVQGVVLLATTEPKLVATLTKLLNNYGGEIKELLALIPSQE